jgi:uncharacterized membrane protein
MMLFLGYGALLARSMSGSDDAGVKKLGSITSGIGLLLMFIAGFALISKIGYSFTTPWILIKLVIWIALGGLIALINRKPECAKGLWWALIGLGFLGSLMVYVRPF